VLDFHQLPRAVTQCGRYPRLATPVNLTARWDTPSGRVPGAGIQSARAPAKPARPEPFLPTITR